MSENTHTLSILGLMSGTSLDGLDLALCEFEKDNNAYTFRILKAHTVDYAPIWKARLSGAFGCNAREYLELHVNYGRYLAEQCLAFLGETGVKPGAIASHGHTVFHRPELGYSSQLGCGATLAALTSITTVCDFRSLDVALGGQGAPLVPVGDKWLFGQYAACLNIGGIANISYDDGQGRRLAYDVCEANMLLNYLAEKAGQSFDRDGHMARSGTVNLPLLDALNKQDYYVRKGAKSLGREWFEKHLLPILEGTNIKENDLLATATEHVSDILAMALNEQELRNVLITGGGALNGFLMDKLRSKTGADIVVPEAQLVNFKEALVFAFLGYLRLKGETNTFKSVTGAGVDSIGGAIYG